MVIESYKVETAARRSYVKTESERTQMTQWRGGEQRQITAERQAVYAEFSQTAQQMLAGQGEENAQATLNGEGQGNAPAASTGPGGVSMAAPTVRSPYELKLEMLRQFIYQLTGRRINVSFENLGMGAFQTMPSGKIRMLPFAQGGEIIREKTTFESEAVSFAAKGLVKTADGKTIDIDMQLNMSRSFYESSKTTLNWGSPGGKLCDPLVVNFGGKAASLTQRKFSFDLDADGKMDEIAFAGAGSGFLALDKNGDGKINDGNELFGPQSGNGFADLRGYDADKNGWIDENDEVFAKLRVWSRDEYGNDQLFTLKELGIGAIYLGETETQFQMSDDKGQMQGQMRSTSFFLKENGGAGYIHHIDLLA